jgi:hypothetical protein
MELKQTFLVIADISGYTKFIRKHRFSLIHAEHIISELLESVIKTAASPLVLHELEGDAVTFYAISDGSQSMAQDICCQVQQFFEAFRKRERELVSDCSTCDCEACTNVGQLKLKAILHHGEAVFTRLRHFDKVAGEDVILTHRLLKNSIQSNEYLLMTEAFYTLLGGLENQTPERRKEHCEGLGNVNIMVYYLSSPVQPPVKRSFWQKLITIMKRGVYVLKRLLIKPKKRYRNLEAMQQIGETDFEHA